MRARQIVYVKFNFNNFLRTTHWCFHTKFFCCSYSNDNKVHRNGRDPVVWLETKHDRTFSIDEIYRREFGSFRFVVEFRLSVVPIENHRHEEKNRVERLVQSFFGLVHWRLESDRTKVFAKTFPLYNRDTFVIQKLRKILNCREICSRTMTDEHKASQIHRRTINFRFHWCNDRTQR